MPKLPAKIAKAATAETTEIGGAFEPLPAGRYAAKLSAVNASTNSQGNPMWTIEFDNITTLDGAKKPGRQFLRINLPTDAPGRDQEKSKWETSVRMANARLKQFFESMGFTTDSDTDEMIGSRVGLQLTVRTIQQGARTGEKTNEVHSLFELDESTVEALDAGADDAGAGAPDDF